jgi:hypothetical protein
VSDTAEHRISATRRIAAPASRIFAVISHPNGHVAIDGSGMLMAAPDAQPLRAVGDSFLMNMDREPLGDLPLGKYQTVNKVTKYEQDTELAWQVGSADHKPIGHVYGYRLDPLGDLETEVTSYCDWSEVPERWLARLSWPVVPVTALESSLDNLQQLVEHQKAPSIN